MSRAKPVAERFWAKVDIGSTDDCWPWTGATEKGYGKFMRTWGESMRPAHRVAYELEVGPIPDGMQLDHLCHTRDLTCPGGECAHRRCVNPAHLEPVTQRTNLDRGVARRVTCRRNHVLAEVGRLADGRCRECNRENCQRGYLRRMDRETF